MPDPISIGLLAALWVIFLWSPMMRTLRSVSFLLLASAAYLSAPFFVPSLAPWIQAAVALAIALALIVWNRPFLAITREERSFIAALDRLNTQLNAAADAFERHPDQKDAWRKSLELASNELSELAAPSEEWAAARADLLALLRARLELLSQPVVSRQEFERFVAQRDQVHRRLRAVRSRSERIWKV